jgi:hypothetical protein
MKVNLLLISFCLLISGANAQKHWIIPDFAVVQAAGSIGSVSAGVGYNVFKSHARLSTHFGTVPAVFGGPYQVVSAKLFFKPVTLTIWNRVRMNPVDFGLMASYHFGRNFEKQWPEDSQIREYFWWHPAFRTHVAMESSVTYEFKKGRALTLVSGYVELNTNELYFLDYLRNRERMRFGDIIKIGTGVRVHF